MEAWRNSGHVKDYVDEWHTHPGARPMPSKTERTEILRRSTEHRDEPLLELIVGSRSVYAGMALRREYCPLVTVHSL